LHVGDAELLELELADVDMVDHGLRRLRVHSTCVGAHADRRGHTAGTLARAVLEQIRELEDDLQERVSIEVRAVAEPELHVPGDGEAEHLLTARRRERQEHLLSAHAPRREVASRSPS
jgi:hypothetical protein